MYDMKKLLFLLVVSFAAIGCSDKENLIPGVPDEFPVPKSETSEKIIPAEGGTFDFTFAESHIFATAVEMKDTFPDRDFVFDNYNHFLQRDSGEWKYVAIEEKGDTVRCDWVTVIRSLEEFVLPYNHCSTHLKFSVEPNPNMEKRTMILVYKTDKLYHYYDIYGNNFFTKKFRLYQEGRE
jgi:hypothetical protein